MVPAGCGCSAGRLSARLPRRSRAGHSPGRPIVGALNYRWLFWFPGISLGVATVAARGQGGGAESPVRVRWPGELGRAFLLSAWRVALLCDQSRLQLGMGIGPGAVAARPGCGRPWPGSPSSPRGAVAAIRHRHAHDGDTGRVDDEPRGLLFGMAIYAAFAFLPEFLQTPPSAELRFGSASLVPGCPVAGQRRVFRLRRRVGIGSRTRFGAKKVLVAARSSSWSPSCCSPGRTTTCGRS